MSRLPFGTAQQHVGADGIVLEAGAVFEIRLCKVAMEMQLADVVELPVDRPL